MGAHLVPAPPEPLLSGAANLAALPAAASNRNVIAKTTDGGVYISDGSAWQQISPPTGTYGLLAKSLEQQFPRPVALVEDGADHLHQGLGFDAAGNLVTAALALAGGRTVQTTTDLISFTTKAAPDGTYSLKTSTRLASGALLAVTTNASGPKLYRSTDNFATSTNVLTLSTGAAMLNSGISQDPNTGTVYLAEYNPATATGLDTVWQSTDDGVTWTVHSTFQTNLLGASGQDVIRHIHSVLACHDSTLLLATGDDLTQAGIWKWSGSAWVRQTPVDNSLGGQRWRTVTLIERHDTDGVWRIYWGRDSSGQTQGEIGCAPLTDLSNYTQLASVESGIFYACKVADGTILFGGAQEGGVNEDNLVRIWAVKPDQTVYEAWRTIKHPLATGGSTYATVSNLKASADGTVVSWTVNNVKWGDAPGSSYTGATFIGHLEKGLKTTDRIGFPLKSGAPETWTVIGTTQNPTIDSTITTPARIPEMILTIAVKTGQRYVAIFDGQFSTSATAGSMFLGISFRGISIASDDQRRYTGMASGENFDAFKHQTWTADSTGLIDVEAKWWNSSAITFTSVGGRRRLTVMPLEKAIDAGLL